MNELPLGRTIDAPAAYWPEVLVGIPREQGRSRLQLADVPLSGWDRWTAWEMAWLDGQGRRQLGVLDIRVSAESLRIMESKSLKLYLNSCFYRRFADQVALQAELEMRLTECCGGEVELDYLDLEEASSSLAVTAAPGQCLDVLRDKQEPAAALRVLEEAEASLWYSHLFRSLCPVTGQPDWATLFIETRGVALEPEGLLGYLLEYADHQGFHENCVEAIFADIWHQCQPQALAVTARYTRRGGIDINPYRTSDPALPERNLRLVRQ